MAIVEEVIGNLSLKGVALLVIGGYLLFYIAKRVDEKIRLRKLPGVHANSVPSLVPFGINIIRQTVIATMNHKNLEKWREILSHSKLWTAEARVLNRRVLFTADPENIKAILATQFGDYGKGEPFHEEWKEFLGDSIFATDGEKWHNSRQLIRPQFIKDRVSDLHCFETHIWTFFKTLAKGGALEGEHERVDLERGDGIEVDISELLFRYTLDAATDFLLGKNVKSLTTPNEPFAEAFAEVQRVQNVIARAGPANLLVPRGSFRRGLKVINEFVNQYIERTLRLSPKELATKTKSDEGYTFLHALASFTRDRTVLRDQLVAVLLAGRDTTAATLSWTMYELGRHPECVRRLREEILATVGPTRAPTYADLKGMKYLQNVMNETLRLYPAVPFNVRLALHDTTLPRGGGPDGTQPVAVLKDTPIGYSTLVMQRRADLYPPVGPNFAPVEEFSPERWMHWQPKPWQYVPFNGGPRICVGQQFALTEMGYVLCRMFQRYERIESRMGPIDGGKPTLKAEIVLQPGDGVRVALWKAKDGLRLN